MKRFLKKIIKKIIGGAGVEVKFKVQGDKKVAWRMTYREVAKFLYFKRLYEKMKDINGDIVECGVGNGKSLLMLAFLAKDEMKGRVLWGFDSFEGFPEPRDEDKSPRMPKKGDWKNVSIAGVEELFYSSGLDKDFIMRYVILIKGFFNESLSKYRGQSIALLHIDADLYDSYLTVLKELYPKVVKGGIVCFDEYMNTEEHLKFPGAQKAIDEYFTDKDVQIIRDKIMGKYYLIKK